MFDEGMVAAFSVPQVSLGRSAGRALVVLLLLVAFLSMGLKAGAQTPPPAAAPVVLTVVGTDGASREVTAADLEKLPRQSVSDKDSTVYEGVPLGEVVGLVGAPLGDRLSHHESPTWYVVVEAKDGYRALFSLFEVDPAHRQQTILLVDRKNGNPLPADQGPLLTVALGESRRARWVRQVTRIRLGRL